MKMILSLAVAMIVAATSLSAGQFDDSRPSWAPREPAVGIQIPLLLKLKLKRWASKHEVVSQYDSKGLEATFQGRRPLSPTAPCPLTPVELEEVASLNRQVAIIELKHEKQELQQPRLDPLEPKADVKQAQLDEIESLRSEIETLKQLIANQSDSNATENSEVISDEPEVSISTPLMAGIASLGGASLALLGSFFFPRRDVAS